MPRSSAASQTDATVASGNVPVVGRAANDGAQSAPKLVPHYVVTAELAAAFLRDAMTFPAEAVEALPSDAPERLAWMEQIQGAAWRDQAEIALVHGLGEQPVTLAGINDFGARIEWVRGLTVATVGAVGVNAESFATMPIDALRARIEECHSTLHRGLCMVFRAAPEHRAKLIAAKRARSLPRFTARSALILALGELPEVEALLRRMPRGEGAALDTLRLAHPVWLRRRKAGETPLGGQTSDLAARTYMTLRPMRERILEAGRYLTQGRPDRKGDYAGYQRPVSRKRKKTPA